MVKNEHGGSRLVRSHLTNVYYLKVAVKCHELERKVIQYRRRKDAVMNSWSQISNLYIKLDFIVNDTQIGMEKMKDYG